MSLLRGPLGPFLLCLPLLCLNPAVAMPLAAEVFINEFHYDNAGADSGEFIELAGTAGTDLTGWQLLLYNGSNGLSYADLDLSGVLGDDTGSGFGFRLADLGGVSVQNGTPDGMALVDSTGSVREFISYEGVLVALGGAATGLSSVDVGVRESSSTAIGSSLQRVGAGSRGADFMWSVTTAATPGTLNGEQRLLAVDVARQSDVPLTAGAPWPLWLLGLASLGLRRRLVATG
jgi:hypothetical protein